MDWEAVSAELGKKLDPANVKKPSGSFGPKGDYIEGWHAIAEANRIFGYGGWSYTIALSQDALEEGKNGKGEPQWQAAYTCVCTVTVDGVVRQDVGFGSGFAKTKFDAIEGATKEAATDALKRCLRTFGNPFGLALYDKTKANVGFDEPAFDPAAARDRLLKAIANARTLPEVSAVNEQEGEVLRRLKAEAPDDYAPVVKAYSERKKALRGPDPAMQAPQDGHVSGAFAHA